MLPGRNARCGRAVIGVVFLVGTSVVRISLLDFFFFFFFFFSKRPPLWSKGNIVASHLAGPGSIPSRVSFPG